MKRALLWMLPLILFIGFWKWRANQHDWRSRLRASPTLTLISLDSMFGTGKIADDRIDGFRVLGKTTLRGADRLKAIEAAESSEHEDGYQNSCTFEPRVALLTEDKQTRIALCFTCGDGAAKIGDTRASFRIYNRRYAQGKAAEDQLNILLRRAHVPISPLD